MAYTKQTWADLPSKNTPINAERLTHIEDGIFNAAQTADTAASTAGTAAANVGIVSGRVETLTGRVNGLDTAVSNKVDKVTGKGLSTNDYDDTDKGKVDSLGTASTKNSTSVVTQSTDLVESGAVYGAIEDTTGWIGGNLLYYNATSGSNNGVGYTVNADKTITANRTETSSNNSQFTVLNRNSDNFKLPTDRYVFSGCPSGGSTNTYQMICQCTRNGSLYELGRDNGDGLVADIYDTDVLQIVLLVNSAYNADNLKFEPMISRAKMPYRPHHASVADSLAEKADNSVIGTVENGTTASQAYAVGSHFIRGGAFCTVTSAISANESLVGSSKFSSGDVADDLNVAYSSVDSLTIGTISVNSLVKIGKIINLNIRLSGVTVSGYTEFGDIPSAFRPKDAEIEAIGNVGGAPALFVIKSNGKLISRTAVTNSNIFLNAFYICN